MDKLETAKYVRKPFNVEAVQLSEENFDLVLAWTRGAVETTDGGERFIRVRTQNPLDERQKRAYVGDWVLKANGGFKIFPHKNFKRNFMLDPQHLPDPAQARMDEITVTTTEKTEPISAKDAIQKMVPRQRNT